MNPKATPLRASGFPPLSIDAILVFLLALDENICSASWARYYGWLDRRERDRLAAFRFRKDSVAYLLSRALARDVCGRYAGVPEREVRFRTSPHGKPSVCDGSLDFSLSHSGRLIALAVTRSREIGVDTESSELDLDAVACVGEQLSRRERSRLETCAGPQRRELFHHLWMLKEAYVKADGRGLSLPLDAFTVEFPVDRNGIGLVAHTPLLADVDDYGLALFRTRSKHAFALAWKGRRPGSVVPPEISAWHLVPGALPRPEALEALGRRLPRAGDAAGGASPMRQ